jgi:putative tryptophan/tyrosine transport system substrate-binding protein
VKRREFITLLGGTVAWPLVAWAQKGGRLRRIGVLMGVSESDPALPVRIEAFRHGLEKRGWFEDRTIRIDYRFSNASAKLAQVFARELAGLQPDVIFAQTPHVTSALKRETRTIPIVFVSISDPVGSGLVESLARPAGNITGFLLYEEGITGKWLAMLQEVVPNVSRVALILNPRASTYVQHLPATQAMAASLNINLELIDNTAELASSIEAFARTLHGGLVVLPDATNILHRDLIISLAAEHRLPAVYWSRDPVAAGGLMTYCIDEDDQFLQAASYVDRILRGEKPSDLPVQAPTKFRTILNLRTAKALGLEPPPTLLARADEVIE